ncbi:MAG: hypothetical protein EON54_05095, partial [Alcaligenaceae bacterium]
MTNGLRWTELAKDNFPELLAGALVVHHPARSYLDSYNVLNEDIAIGFSEFRESSKYNPPCIFVIDKKGLPETLSWLKFFAPETSPLSQFGRVLSFDDWVLFGSEEIQRNLEFREDKWACLVVGESLAQGDNEIGLDALPLARVSACYSSTVARASSIYGNDKATRECINRLKIVEADDRFSRRQVTVAELLPIWSLLETDFQWQMDAQEAVELALDTAKKYFPQKSKSLIEEEFNYFLHNGFYSDSIEERVIAFQRLVKDLSFPSGTKRNKSIVACLVACAAFLVGRGTSHEFLMRRVGRDYPAAPVWFGLIAALTGPGCWSAEWTRATRSVERQIRSNFTWEDVSGFDVSWAEFSWLASTFDGPDIFSTLPKMANRALSIEMVPGAACQLRFSASSVESDARSGATASENSDELKETLEQFIKLANHAQKIINESSANQKERVYS